MALAPAGVPDFHHDETLRNGLAVTIRALRPDDRERIARAVALLDAQSIYTRLFAHRTALSPAGLDRIMTVDWANEIALVVTAGAPPDELIIGSGRAVASPGAGEQRMAEVAFVVEEDYQGQGIAGRLLAHLAVLARQRGITAFEADVLPQNRAMLAVFARSGLPVTRRHEGGTVRLVLALGPAPAP